MDMFGVVTVGDLWQFAQVIVGEMKRSVPFIKLTWRDKTVGKTWRKERIIKASDVKARDDLNDMRRGRAFADKTKYTRKTKHKGRIDDA